MARLVCALVVGACLMTHVAASENYKEVCGRAFQGDHRGQEKVIVGQSAYNGDWPWLVHVDIPHSGCSASLISENYVITAQHCYGHDHYVTDGEPLHPVRIGSPDDRNGTVYGVEKVHYYNTSIPFDDAIDVFGHDLAIVKLNRSVEFSALASPICLSDARVEDVTSHIVAVGWGGTYLTPDPRNKTYPFVAREQIIPLRSRSEWCPLEDRYDDSICVGSDHRGPTDGDSGGPLQVDLRKRWHLAGITSRGDWPGLVGWGLYTRVSSHCDWIAEVTEGEVKCEKSG